MAKQKICIIGGSLSGLITSIGLSKLNCDIDLITGDINKKIKSTRTVAISQNNFDYLDKLNIFKSTKKELWPCSIMKLYIENKNGKFTNIFELNKNNNSKKILYMCENIKIIKLMLNKIKKTRSISIKNYGKVSEVLNSGLLKSIKAGNKNPKYNLIIICAGSNSDLVKKIFGTKIIERSYDEISITGMLNHNSIENNVARQIFLDEGVLALLPVSNTSTSIVWSVKKDKNKKNESFLKKKIIHYSSNFYKKIKFTGKIEIKNLNFLIRNNYYQNRTLLFGDALHVVHPLAGQGFNMTIRDLISLEKTLKNKIDLGLDIGSEDMLSEFSNETKPRNFVYSMGIDLIKNSFSIKNQTIKKIRNDVIKNLNNNNLMKNIFFDFADRGLKF
tara:strand:+ start:808 stop:1971 length:1164 start_codon:yes stop_codon:yes gene_type:complete